VRRAPTSTVHRKKRDEKTTGLRVHSDAGNYDKGGVRGIRTSFACAGIQPGATGEGEEDSLKEKTAEDKTVKRPEHQQNSERAFSKIGGTTESRRQGHKAFA